MERRDVRDLPRRVRDARAVRPDVERDLQCPHVRGRVLGERKLGRVVLVEGLESEVDVAFFR